MEVSPLTILFGTSSLSSIYMQPEPWLVQNRAASRLSVSWSPDRHSRPTPNPNPNPNRKAYSPYSVFRTP